MYYNYIHKHTNKMVKITDDKTIFPSDSKYQSYFESFPYPLSDFQKHAISAIVDGDHALVCAPTGSGKTLPAEFAIRHFTGLGKRVIYCSPIKALSNQKLFDFTRKYQDITFGLLTGDIKTNPTAQVLIMTTEILMNRLFTLSKDNVSSKETASTLSFDMDIENELGAVIFDELHYINDQHRGHVWEQSILMLPKHIQMVMLSATLDDPVKFARWCEGAEGALSEATSQASSSAAKLPLSEATSQASSSAAKLPLSEATSQASSSEAKVPLSEATSQASSSEAKVPLKQVVICSTNHRVVPLTHYSFVCSSEGLFKKVKNKELEQRVRSSLNQCLPIKTSSGDFIEDTYFETGAILNLMSDNNTISRRKFVLNELFTHLKTNNMLPAIVFIFSRKLVEQCAEEITVPLFDSDLEDYNPFLVRKECDAVLRRLPNWREYADLPEYQTLVSLLEKGIGIHHSGMIPILREIVELMISKKYIKVLFATESFAIGLDCPIKTAVFISLKKFDGSQQRYLLPHEYTQMAGRAGRRGLDTVGHVVHCSNLFEQPQLETYKEILCGKPQKLVSKFQVYYPMLLNVFKNTGHASIEDLVGFADKSMLKSELESAERGIISELEAIDGRVKIKDNFMNNVKTPREMLAEYNKVLEILPYAANKKRKEIDATIKKMKADNAGLDKDHGYYVEYKKLMDEKKQKESQLVGTQYYIQACVEKLLKIMEETSIITNVEPGHYMLTPELGNIAVRMAEINPVLISLLCVQWKYFEEFSVSQIAAFFSIFTDVRVAEEIRCGATNCSYDRFLDNKIGEFEKVRESLISKEEYSKVYGSSGLDGFCYDILDDVFEWCECDDEQSCKQLIARIYQEKGISVGDFTKAILKISTISREMQGVCEVMNKTEFMHKLASIDKMILKYVATSQSLYL
jgi:superfamily II RNA helicase